jgi:hypothetical protein
LPTFGSPESQHICSFRQMQFLSRLMFMLAGLANRRQPGNPQTIVVFGQMQFSSQLCSCWPGLPTFGRPETQNFCSFRQMQFLSRLMLMLAGLANLRQPGNSKIFAVFVKCDSRLVNVHAGRACQPSAGRKAKNFAVFVK